MRRPESDGVSGRPNGEKRRMTRGTRMQKNKGATMNRHSKVLKAKTIGVCIPVSMAQEIDQRAHSMHLTPAHYCRIILSNWLESGDTLTLEEQ